MNKKNLLVFLNILFFLFNLSFFHWSAFADDTADNSQAAVDATLASQASSVPSPESLTEPLSSETASDAMTGLEDAVATGETAVDESASTETAAEAPAEPAIKPTVVIKQRGVELQLEVTYDHPMDQAANDYIESVQMESPTGEFLGVKSFSPNEKQALAIFMINPTLYKNDSVVFKAKSSKLGEIKTTSKLEVTPEPEAAVPAAEVSESSAPAASVSESAPAASNEPKKEEKKKKKGWW